MLKWRKKKNSEEIVARPEEYQAVNVAILSIDRLSEALQTGKYHTKGGHGFAAEDANTVYDLFRGKLARLVGKNNAVNGADRVSSGETLQTKYYASAGDTVSSAFNPETGVYRYGDMKLEVPADQYNEALDRIKEKIAAGKIPGLSDSEDAYKLVHKGNITYEQARDIAEGGNVESLKFDAASQSIVGVSSLGISFVVTFASLKKKGMDTQAALKEATISSIKVGSLSYVSAIAVAQALRTDASAVATKVVRDAMKAVYSTDIGQFLIDHLAEASLQNGVYGGAAYNHVAKLLRTNFIAVPVITVVRSLPDFWYSSISKNQSWAQTAKNTGSRFSNAAISTSSSMVGIAMGAPLGPWGSFIGAFVFSAISVNYTSAATKQFLDRLAPDDRDILNKTIHEISTIVITDHGFSESEISVYWDRARALMTPSWYREMYALHDNDSQPETRRSYALKHLDLLARGVRGEVPT